MTLDWVTALQREALSDKSEWQAICTIYSVHQVVVMFKITHITIRRFSLAEILLMVVINQMEAKRKDSATRSR